MIAVLTEKTCTGCRERRPTSEFYKMSKAADGLQSRCKACTRVDSRQWRQANPERSRDFSLQHYFGISVAQYNEILIAQNGVCAICRKVCCSGKRLAVDHQHFGDELVRGLLCINCNLLLGEAEDDQDVILRAVAYLRMRAAPST